MTIHSIGELHPLPNRPGIRARPLIATKHGFTSFFVSEFEMDEGASVPLHTHPIEEAVVVTEGMVTIQLGDETVTATAGSVVRIPPGVPHALRNQAPDSARGLGAAAWNHADFFRGATTYLEGIPPTA
jgi:quercetin dioxygenase-like cupin family protein